MPDKKEKVKKKYLMRLSSVIYLLIGLVFIAGIIGPFIWQCTIPKYVDISNDQAVQDSILLEESLTIWNGFVSIALGFVATTLSIVSMVMNFKTIEDARIVQRDTIETLEKVKSIQEGIQELRNHSFQDRGAGARITETTAQFSKSPTKDSGDEA